MRLQPAWRSAIRFIRTRSTGGRSISWTVPHGHLIQRSGWTPRRRRRARSKSFTPRLVLGLDPRIGQLTIETDPRSGRGQACSPRGSANERVEPSRQARSRSSRFIGIDALFTVRPFFGARRIARTLTEEGFPIDRKRVRRLMRLMGIAALGP